MTQVREQKACRWCSLQELHSEDVNVPLCTGEQAIVKVHLAGLAS